MQNTKRQALTYANTSTKVREGIDDDNGSVVKEIQDNIRRLAFKHNIYVTDEEAQVIQDYFPARAVIMDPSAKRYIESTHAILAVLNSYCNDDARSQCDWLRDNGVSTMAIGDAANVKIGADHNCMLANNSRDLYRIASNTAGATSTSLVDYRNAATHPRHRTPHCITGAQNCSYEASVAFAMHSLYNITPVQLAKIFVEHRLVKLVAYMFMPLVLYDPDLARLDEAGMAVRRVGGDYHFSMHDYSIPYVHNAVNWETWARVTSIDCGDFRIIRETVRTHGPLHVICFVRVKLCDDPVYMSAPFSEITAKYYRVPSFRAAAHGHFAVPQDQLPHRLVPRHVVDSSLAYGDRMNAEAFKFTEFMALLSGFLRTIKIGSVIYHDRWDPNPEDFIDMAISLFCISASRRAFRTGTISYVFDHLKNWRDSNAITFEVRQFVMRCVNWFNDKVDPRGPLAKRDARPSDAIWRYVVKTVASTTWTHSVVVADTLFHHGPIQMHHIANMPAPEEPSKPHSAPTTTTVTVTPPPAAQQQAVVRAPTAMANGTTHEPVAAELQRPPPPPPAKVAPAKPAGPPPAPVAKVAPSVPTVVKGSAAHEQAVVNALPFVIAPKGAGNINSDIVPAKLVISNNASFSPGHCIMRSVYEAAGCTTPPAVFVSQVKQRVARFVGQHASSLTRAEFDSYFDKGDWNNRCADTVLDVLPEFVGANITVVDQDQGVNHTLMPPVAGRRTIHIYYSANHYSSRPRGGAVNKFEPLIASVLAHLQENELLIPTEAIEISGAPGHLCNYLASVNIDTTLCHYTPGIPLTKLHPDVGLHRYTDIKQLHKIVASKFELVICDAARDTNSEALLAPCLDASLLMLKEGGHLLVKTFGNPHALWRKMLHFETCHTIECDTPGSTEVYYICGNFRAAPTDEAEAYRTARAAFNQEVTTHKCAYSYKAVQKFARTHFNTIKLGKEFPRRMADHTFEFRALTGYASTAKTTRAAELYDGAMFVAPSKVLAMEHMKVHSLVSYTPHKALTNAHKFQVIVIDECSQLPVEYLMMIHSCNPNARLIILGDIYQVPYVDIELKQKFTTFREIGVDNNLYRVFKIPLDIMTALNKKFGYTMEFAGSVLKGMCNYTGDLLDLKKKDVKHIVFNAKSCELLSREGYNASTITTYQGSRQAYVVFHIDARSVDSELLGRCEWVYTAMTRGTDKLVTYGEGNYIRQYLNIDGTNVRNYEEVTGIVNLADSYMLPTPEVNPDAIKVKEPAFVPESFAPSVAATAIVLEHAMPHVNEASTHTMFNKPVALPPVESGVLKVNTDALLHIPRTFRGHQLLPDVPLVRNQVSNDVKTTVNTMMKRYAKGIPSQKGRMVTIKANEIYNGVVKACTGKCTPATKRQFGEDLKARCKTEDLRYHAKEYLISVQKKGPSLFASDMEKAFNEFDETITFANKRQAKFDEKEGHDTSDKSGQGIAAMSKRMNIIYSAIARCLLTAVRDIARCNGMRLIIATHGSDEDISKEYAAMVAEVPEHRKWVCADVEQWDSMFQDFMAQLSVLLMRTIGMSEWVCTFFYEFRTHWTMIIQTQYGYIKLSGKWKQTSGNPFTILCNTLCNLGLIYHIYEFKNLHLALFKGDDSAVYCDGAKLSPEGQLFLLDSGFVLKVHVDDVGEFAGFLLTPYGFFPDVLRYACKFVGKVYRDPEHFTEAKTSVSARIAVVKSQEQLNFGCVATERHYGRHRLTAEHALLLFHFLANGASKVSFADLKPVEKFTADDATHENGL